MGISFFKKFTPETDVIIPGKARVKFETLDGILGYHETDNDDIANSLRQFIQEQRYGLSQISEEEFHKDYVEPKKKGKRRIAPQAHWTREALGGSGYESGTHPVAVLSPEEVAKKAAVVSRAPDCGTTMEDAPPEGVGESPSPAKTPPAPAPTVGQRKKPTGAKLPTAK